ncbi:MAG: 23S rRNA (guanosine(2251)-2'-O)-methyltransferase RlmB [Clostridia bacterium]|nr:23S rRNA (guanosine(2251)-2'-O)-methyltransferase RlmB [Clostridia bacterium]
MHRGEITRKATGGKRSSGGTYGSGRNENFRPAGVGAFESGSATNFEVENAGILAGRNPVTEALKAGEDCRIEKLIIAKGAEGSIKKIEGMARDLRIPIHYAEKTALDRIAGSGAHQGVVAYTSEFEYCEVEDILELANERGEKPFIVILDNIEDPHNLGAIMRTAETAGVHGIIIPKRRAVGITQTVAKASAGAVEYMLCAKVANIAQTIDFLKERNVWVAACDMGGRCYSEAALEGSLALVVGSEGFGISRLVKEKCDFTLSIPMKGKINSLNASNAAAVLMYEVRRQRDAKNL